MNSMSSMMFSSSFLGLKATESGYDFTDKIDFKNKENVEFSETLEKSSTQEKKIFDTKRKQTIEKEHKYSKGDTLSGPAESSTGQFITCDISAPKSVPIQHNSVNDTSCCANCNIS